jgi:hypothetical protein
LRLGLGLGLGLGCLDEPRLEVVVDHHIVPVHLKAVLVVDHHLLHGEERVDDHLLKRRVKVRRRVGVEAWDGVRVGVGVRDRVRVRERVEVRVRASLLDLPKELVGARRAVLADEVPG